MENSFFSSTAVNVQSPSADLLVVPERLQLTLKTEENQSDIIKKIIGIGNIVNSLPHTPYVAIGYNAELS